MSGVRREGRARFFFKNLPCSRKSPSSFPRANGSQQACRLRHHVGDGARPGIVSGDGGWSTMRAEGRGGGGDKVRGAGNEAKKNIFSSMLHSQ